ncbi:MAG: hypothetical protein AAFY04_10455, partial [Pseudomonadota bacterium]
PGGNDEARRHKKANAGDGRSRRKSQGSAPQRAPHRQGGPDKRRSGNTAQNPHMHKPRHLKTADPDSPFAVLAALKSAEDTKKPDRQKEKKDPAAQKTPEPAKP